MLPIFPNLNPAPSHTSGSLPRIVCAWPRPRPVLLLALAATLACAGADTPKAKTVPELRAFFQQNCTRCHGLDGSAHGPDGKRLGGMDFTVVAEEFRQAGGPGSEREIRRMSRGILNGILFGVTMPSWKAQLSPEDAQLMVKEVLLKAERGKVIEPPPPEGSSPK